MSLDFRSMRGAPISSVAFEEKVGVRRWVLAGNRSSIRSTQPATPYWSVIFIFYSIRLLLLPLCVVFLYLDLHPPLFTQPWVSSH